MEKLDDFFDIDAELDDVLDNSYFSVEEELVDTEDDEFSSEIDIENVRSLRGFVIINSPLQNYHLTLRSGKRIRPAPAESPRSGRKQG